MPSTASRSPPSSGKRGARTISEPRPHSAIASLMYWTSLTWVSRCSNGVNQRYTSSASWYRPLIARFQSSRLSSGKALTSPETHRAQQHTLQRQVIDAAKEDISVADPVDQIRDATHVI